MNAAIQEEPIEGFDRHAALGNVVRFVPPGREETHLAGGEWAASLDLVDQAAALIRACESRASEAEARAKEVAFRAIEELRTAHFRVEEAQTRAREIEQQTAEELRQAQGRIASAEAWAEGAEERAREAEGRAHAAEARAREAEEWLHRLTDALRQKLLSAAPAPAAENPLRALKLMSAG